MRQCDAIWGAHWTAFDALDDATVDRQNTVGTWSARDVMVHIANWEEETCRQVRALDAGQPLPRTYTSDAELDAWNDEHVAPWHSVELAEARANVLRCHLDLLALVLASPSVQPGWVLGNYGGHLDDLLAAQRDPG
jgi:hypothetical protein